MRRRLTGRLVVCGARGSVLLAGIAAGVGCAIAPYRAGFVDLPVPLPHGAFERALEIVRLQYPNLELVDPAAFRVQSQWRTFQDRDVAARSRLTLWRERDRLFAIVEIQYLRVPTFGDPAWSSVTSDRARERELLDRIRAAIVEV